VECCGVFVEFCGRFFTYFLVGNGFCVRLLLTREVFCVVLSDEN